MTEKNNIPKRWQVKKLGEVCTYSKGKMPQVLVEEKNNQCSIPYINIKAFEKGIFAEYTDGLKCNLCDDNDLLMVWDGARCGLIGKAKKGAVGSTLMKILPKENIHKEFLYHFISSKFWALNTKPKGVGIPHIEPTLLWNFELVVPPLPEQQAIVSKIEELLSDLENGKQQLQTAQQQLKVYRQSLLKWAFEGKLTNNDVKEGELPKGWKWATLGEICESNRKCSYGVLVPGDHVADGITLVRVGDIDNDGKIVQNNMKKISPTIAGKFKRTFLEGGEVVISLVGAIGRTAVVPFSLKGANTARAVGVIPVAKNLSAKFVEAMLRCPLKIKEHNDSSHEVARKTLNLEDVVKSKIPMPPFEEQQLIVEELESKLTVCDNIEETISHSLQQAETLKQSILKKAFEGKLIDQGYYED